MTISLDQIADELAVAPQELQRRSLIAYFDREQRLANLDIADLQDRYDVRTAHDLAAKIERGEVSAHPAWEELIEWEQLEAFLSRLDAWRVDLEQTDV